MIELLLEGTEFPPGYSQCGQTLLVAAKLQLLVRTAVAEGTVPEFNEKLHPRR